MRTFLLPSLLVSVFSPLVALAAPATYNLLAPVGTLPGTVTLTQYVKGVFETAIGITGVLAVIMIIICGIRLIGTGSVAGKSEAKQCMWNAVFGILLAIGSWLLLNTINPLLLKNDAQLTVNQAVTPAPAPGAPTVEAAPTANGCYFQYKESSGSTRYIKSGTQEMCETLRNDYQSSGIGSVLTNCFCNKPAAAGVATPTSAPPTTSVAGSVTCSQSGLNLCEPNARVCTNAKCPRFAAWAATYAGGAATANLLKALIVQESSCVANASQVVGFDGKSAGPIHLIPSTANNFKGPCGVTATISVDWLANEANWEKSICIASKYIQSLATPCGPSIRNIAAAYNGGSGVCSPSVSCAGDTNCAGVAVQKWECLYDDAAHKQCNGGYVNTRKYAGNVLYCTNNPGY